MESINKETNIIKNILKKARIILIPYIVFALIAIIVQVILNDSQINAIPSMILVVMKGAVRNTFFAGALWFLTCLFIISIMFSIIKKLKNKLLDIFNMFRFILYIRDNDRS